MGVIIMEEYIEDDKIEEFKKKTMENNIKILKDEMEGEIVFKYKSNAVFDFLNGQKINAIVQYGDDSYVTIEPDGSMTLHKFKVEVIS